MDFVNQTIAQARELIESMTPGGRVTAGLLLAAVVVSLGFLFQQATTGPDEYLFGADPIGRTQLARVESAIAEAGIEFTTEGNRIKVARNDKNAALSAIAEKGELPPDFFNIMDKAISGGSMFDDRETKRRRIESAREAQASLLLSGMQWVDQARVMYSHRENRGLRSTRHASAAVTIEPNPGEQITTRRVRVVKDLIASALDVAMDKVTVTNLGNDAIDGADGVTPEDFDSPYYQTKLRYEQALRQSIQGVLSYIPGVRVGVKAEIDDTESRRLVQVKPEKEGVELQSNIVDDTNTSVRGPAGNRPGAETNSASGPPGRDEALAREDRTEITTSHEDRSFAVGSSQEITLRGGYAVKEAEASINVPRSFVMEVYRQQNPDADNVEGNDLDTALGLLEQSLTSEIENLVTPLLPKLSLGEDEYKQVNVEFTHDLPRTPIPDPSLASNALAMAGRYWDAIAMGGLAIFSLVMLRSIVSSTGSDSSPSLPSLQIARDDSTEEEEEPGGRQKLKLKKPDTLKDDLNDMVTSDPEAAAAILRSWINNNAA